jgi:dienelactone hydrolase
MNPSVRAGIAAGLLATAVLVALGGPAVAGPRPGPPARTPGPGRAIAQTPARKVVPSESRPGLRWIEVAERGGETLRAAVVAPEGVGPAGVVVVLHGTEGFNEDYVHLAEAHAGAGFLTVAGCWFAGNECPHGPPFQGVTLETTRHVRALVAAAAALPRARADRVALFGHSRGAMLALLAAASGTEVRAVVVTSGQFAPGYTAGRRRTPIDVAPVTMVSTLHAPVLILHAAGDEQAHVHWTREYERALHEQGLPVEAHYYDEATHGLAFAATTRDDVQRRAVEFLRKYLDY